MRLALLFLLTVPAAMAQNSDLGLLLGISGPEAEVTTGGVRRVTASVGASFQANYAWQVKQMPFSDLYVELPLVFTVKVFDYTGPSLISGSRATAYFTPGVRLKIHAQSRVGFYVAAGGGVGSFGRAETTIGNDVRVRVGRTTSGALQFGGGIDFRLTRLLSLRFEGRDFVSRKGLASADSPHNVIVQGGLGFHF